MKVSRDICKRVGVDGLLTNSLLRGRVQASVDGQFTRDESLAGADEDRTRRYAM